MKLISWNRLFRNTFPVHRIWQVRHHMNEFKKYETINWLLHWHCAALECASILATKWRHITFGCTSLDQITRNGLPIRGITEIVGESGCGKSQICLQLALNVQLSLANGGLGKSAVYICTEDAFPSKRLVQIAEHHSRTFRNDKWLDNIFIEHCPDTVKMPNAQIGILLHSTSSYNFRKVSWIVFVTGWSDWWCTVQSD